MLGQLQGFHVPLRWYKKKKKKSVSVDCVITQRGKYM